MTDRLTQVINKGGNQYLDGRILKLLGAMKVTNIEFWLFIEKKYTEKLTSEDTFKVIEGLTGLAIAKRGSTEFLYKLQDKIMSKDASSLKDIDVVRAIYGLSLIPREKLIMILYESMRAEATKRLEHFKLVDLI